MVSEKEYSRSLSRGLVWGLGQNYLRWLQDGRRNHHQHHPHHRHRCCHRHLHRPRDGPKMGHDQDVYKIAAKGAQDRTKTAQTHLEALGLNHMEN